MRRLQRLGAEAGGAQGTAAESLKQAQISPFEGLPDKVRCGEFHGILVDVIPREGGGGDSPRKVDVVVSHIQRIGCQLEKN